MSNKKVPVASIHSHFNIFRDLHEAHTGPVSFEEQYKALERFCKWHRRQVEVGQQLMDRLAREHAAAVTMPVTTETGEEASPGYGV